MKIVICTTPIRPVPTDYPPLGSLAVIQALRSAGYEPIFYDIDGLRPSFPEVIRWLQQEAPDVVGISAVVSTAYGYVKQLCTALRQVLPTVRIVVGGNLAASAEILHRFCGVDVCVIGEGEKIAVNLVNAFARQTAQRTHPDLAQIKGITYLDPAGVMVFTGYEAAIPTSELADPDFEILEKSSRIENYITDPKPDGDFDRDPRFSQLHRANKKAATVVFSKGCVARCTFCHRWDKGYRQLPPEKVVTRIRRLMDRYNVGFINFGDENFGSDLKATDQLIDLIAPLDILWRVGGIRAHTIELDRLERMRKSGCVALYYGFESGSDRILHVMEKKLSLDDNVHAARNTHRAGLYTVYQLILGMPGESGETIAETIEMVKQVTEFLPRPPFEYLSVNYLQALPGTPVYEYARTTGAIGPSVEDEEAYLLSISDVDAGDETKFLNFTRLPYLTVQSWRPRLLYEATVHWYRTRSRRNAGSEVLSHPLEDYKQGGYFNRFDVRLSPGLLSLLFPLRRLLIWLWTVRAEYRRTKGNRAMLVSRLWEWLSWDRRRHQGHADYRSLRHVMRDLARQPATPSQKSMMPLRLGR